MIARLLVSFFGSPWHLKNLCLKYNNSTIGTPIRLLWGIYQYENNSSIAWDSTFANEPCFPHGMKSIFVSGDAIIGNDCVIFQQVTIGSVMLPDSKNRGAPIIGDNVYIGAGAKIIGNVRVGNNVRIGANAVVFKDIPDNSVVLVGNQRVITRPSPPDNNFYTFRGQWMYFDEGHWIKVKDQSVLTALGTNTPPKSMTSQDNENY